MNLSFTLTTRCNLRCKHCIRGKQSERVDFSFELFKDLCKQGKELGYNDVCLTGGEPCFHPDFEDMVDYLYDNNHTFIIISNGTMMDRYKFIEKYDLKRMMFGISLDGGSAEMHDANRGDGSFDKTIKTLAYLQSKGYRRRVFSTIGKHNMHDIRNIIETVKKYGIRRMSMPSVINNGCNEDLVLSVEEKEKYSKEINDIAKELGMYIGLPASFRTRMAFGFCSNYRGDEISFNPSGKMNFCCDIVKNGNTIGDMSTFNLEEMIGIKKQISKSMLKKRNELGKNKKELNNCDFCNKYIEKCLNCV